MLPAMNGWNYSCLYLNIHAVVSLIFGCYYYESEIISLSSLPSKGDEHANTQLSKKGPVCVCVCVILKLLLSPYV